MTNFIKDNFHFDGMYLMYEGEQGELTHYYGENGEKCHPTRQDTAKAMFIARFKYGNKPWKTWVNFIVKNFTVEEYHAASTGDKGSPVRAMQDKGFLEPALKKQCKKAGYPTTVAGWKQMVHDEAETWKAAHATA